MKIKPTDKDATSYIGKRAVCSMGIVGIIEAIKELDWGLSFVGKTESGKWWASRNPTLIERE